MSEAVEQAIAKAIGDATAATIDTAKDRRRTREKVNRIYRANAILHHNLPDNVEDVDPLPDIPSEVHVHHHQDHKPEPPNVTVEAPNVTVQVPPQVVPQPQPVASQTQPVAPLQPSAPQTLPEDAPQAPEQPPAPKPTANPKPTRKPLHDRATALLDWLLLAAMALLACTVLGLTVAGLWKGGTYLLGSLQEPAPAAVAPVEEEEPTPTITPLTSSKASLYQELEDRGYHLPGEDQ
jgi:hypothetical protein